MSKPKNIIYSRGYPYGAPMVYIRGGGTKDLEVKDLLRAEGFQWNSLLYAWATIYWSKPFIEKGEIKYRATADILADLEQMGYVIKQKDGDNHAPIYPPQTA